jgi:hypothetical protein
VIIPKNEYNQKIEEFIESNNFTKPTRDNTKVQQRSIKEAIGNCNNIIKHKDKWKYVNTSGTRPRVAVALSGD